MKKLLIGTLMVLGLQSAKAQVYGVFNGAKESTFWSYDLSSGKGDFNASSIERVSVSNANSAGFLPVPTTGTVKLFVPASSGGGVEINNSALKVTSTSSGSPIKFSAYNVEGTTPVTSLFFDIDFNDTEAKNGVLILGIGKNAQGQVFNNTNQILNTAASKGLFAGLRLEFYGGSNIQTYYRTPAFANGNLDNNKAIFTRSGKQNVEIYCNNSNSSQSYKRGARKVRLPAQTYHVYVNGTSITAEGSLDIPKTGEVASDQAINSFVFNASSSANNLLNFSISNIKIGGLQ